MPFETIQDQFKGNLSSNTLTIRNFDIFLFVVVNSIFYKILFIFRERGREGEREEETSISCLLHTPNWGPGLQPRHVP